MKVFVTVGTTQFDALLEAVSSNEVLRLLRKCGYRELLVQYGAGKEPQFDSVDGLEIESFRFKPSIKDLIASADLVISHAGAGTVLETLSSGRRMITVINEKLMDNHQTELAYQMYKDGHLLYCNTDNLPQTIEKIQSAKLTPYVRGQPKKFAQFLDQVMSVRQ